MSTISFSIASVLMFAHQLRAASAAIRTMAPIRSLRRVLLACSLTTVAACGGSPAEDACEAFIDAYSTRVADECGAATRDEVRRGLLVGFSMFGVDECSDFTGVRDEGSFYGECLPAIEVLECDALDLSPASCTDQLQVAR